MSAQRVQDMSRVYRAGLIAASAPDANFHAMMSEHTEALERARVVGVLDEYARAHWVGSFRTEPEGVDGEQVWFCHNDDKGFRGPTPDAARAAAAKAIESGEL